MMPKIKKETLIVAFYILYFVWLLTLTFLTNDTKILNYFVIAIASFYLLLLRSSGDVFVFAFGVILSLLLSTFNYKNFSIYFDTESLKFIPLWLPISWGTTFVALRKFYENVVS